MMNSQVEAALITAVASVTGALIGAIATVVTTRSKQFLTYRKRSVRGTWSGSAEELLAIGPAGAELAKYMVTAELKQFRSRVTGKISVSVDGRVLFHDKFEGRLTTEQDMCLTFWAVDENVHHFGVVVFHIHPSGREMTGHVLSRELSSPEGRVFVMQTHMKRTFDES